MSAPDLVEIDGAAMRRALTEAARAHEGDDVAARRAAAQILKGELERGRAAVRAAVLAGADGETATAALSALADEIVAALYDFTTVHIARARNPTLGERLSVCAVGGYGRDRLAPGSDWDLLFLFWWKKTPWVESVVEHVLYALWDMGVKVGYAARSIDQAMALAFQDWTALTAMMDLRVVCGAPEPADDLQTRLRDHALNGRERRFLEAKLAERAARLDRQETAAFMIEPDIKDGKGGLRDVQTVRWLAKAHAAGDPDRALLTPEEHARLQAAAEFLWRVRTHVHFAIDRAQERLTFDLQPEIAARLGVKDDAAAPAVERFMRRFFLVTRDVSLLFDLAHARMQAAWPAERGSGIARLWRRRRIRPLQDARYALVDGRISFAPSQIDDAGPPALLGLFRAAGAHNAPIHPDGLAAAARLAARIDDDARSDPACAQAFFGALLAPQTVEATLRAMNDTGVLGAYLPEFGDIVARTQFNTYHRYTVDEHTIRVVGALADMESGKGPVEGGFARDVFAKIGRRRALYLAALLHDTGKGAGEQTVEGAKRARGVARRLGLDEEEAELTAWLVAAHLTMSDTAQRRDTGDPRTVAEFAAEVGALERLRLLTLLTFADIAGVGPNVLTGWKTRLLRDLYELTEAALRGGRSDVDGVAAVFAARADAARKALLDSAQDAEDRAALERASATIDDAYWIAFDAETHRRHGAFAVEQARRQVAIGARAWARRGSNTAEIVVYAPDAPGMLARLTRALADQGANVRQMYAFATRRSGVFDVFVVQRAEGADPDGRALDRLADALEAAARGQPGPAAENGAAAPPPDAFDVDASVVIDDDAALNATVIEVSGRDRPGLLADLCEALADLGVNVLSAHVDSMGERAMDVFYATAKDGGVIAASSRRDALRARLLSVLREGEPARRGGRGFARARASGSR